jgi:hypothetical protein
MVDGVMLKTWCEIELIMTLIIEIQFLGCEHFPKSTMLKQDNSAIFFRECVLFLLVLCGSNDFIDFPRFVSEEN